MRVVGAAPLIRAIPSRMFVSARSERPFTWRRRPSSAAARSASSGVDAERRPGAVRTVFGPDAGDAQDLEQAVGDLGTEPVVVGEPAGLGELGQLLVQRGSGTGDLRRLTALEERRDVVRVALDRIGHPAVGHGLVDDLAEDLEHVADLVEDPRQLRVADHRVAAARHAPWPRHRAILGPPPTFSRSALRSAGAADPQAESAGAPASSSPLAPVDEPRPAVRADAARPSGRRRPVVRGCADQSLHKVAGLAQLARGVGASRVRFCAGPVLPERWCRHPRGVSGTDRSIERRLPMAQLPTARAPIGA